MICQLTSRLFSGSALGIVVAAISLCAPLSANGEPEKDGEESGRRAQGLKNMQRSAAQYALASADAPPQNFKFNETPFLRSSNPVSDTQDGVLFLWTNHGRPEAALKLYTFNNKNY